MIEIFIVGVIVIFIALYSGIISSKRFVDDNKDIIMLLKEKDYEFLLLSKYGDKVYDANEVFMKRVRNGFLVGAAVICIFITNFSAIYILVGVLIGFFVFKSQYLSLKSWYKAHLNEVDSLLPYYLKGLEVLIQHYTVPVALARSIDDAPDVFKPGLKEMVAKIEAGDSTIQPYMDFALRYPVRDSMRMMRLLYRLGLGEQEKKHQQLLAFAQNVSNLQQKAREDKYRARLDKMEKMTMTMLVCTGGAGMILLVISAFMMFTKFA